MGATSKMYSARPGRSNRRATRARRAPRVGSGSKWAVTGTDPNGGSTTSYSPGVAGLGEADGDGLDDFGINAMPAQPSAEHSWRDYFGIRHLLRLGRGS